MNGGGLVYVSVELLVNNFVRVKGTKSCSDYALGFKTEIRKNYWQTCPRSRPAPHRGRGRRREKTIKGVQQEHARTGGAKRYPFLSGSSPGNAGAGGAGRAFKGVKRELFDKKGSGGRIWGPIPWGPRGRSEPSNPQKCGVKGNGVIRKRQLPKKARTKKWSKIKKK